ncbi:MAG: class I SAM-dependent methyltransferase [Chlorobi bacterium]|nr:class I SAM-dependent methyltransferase [Chlorobiota bacterium]MCI0714920.1 class I SAM-dependent methyltransferase [Chlorobiota bacterium]
MKPDKESFYRWNEEHAIKHDLDKFYNHPNRLFRFIENKRISVLIDYAGINESDSVLEVGCGAGNILERIKKGKLTGIDISKTQIERAGKKLKNRAELIQSPGEKTQFADKHFDVIICTEVFEHVLDPVEILKEMKRILKDSGTISLSVPNEKLIIFTKWFLLNFGFRRVLEPKESQWDLASKNNLDEWHIHNYSLKLIKLQVKDYFKIYKIARIPFFFIPFRYVLKLKKY